MKSTPKMFVDTGKEPVVVYEPMAHCDSHNVLFVNVA